MTDRASHFQTAQSPWWIKSRTGLIATGEFHKTPGTQRGRQPAVQASLRTLLSLRARDIGRPDKTRLGGGSQAPRPFFFLVFRNDRPPVRRTATVDRYAAYLPNTAELGIRWHARARRGMTRPLTRFQDLDFAVPTNPVALTLFIHYHYLYFPWVSNRAPTPNTSPSVSQPRAQGHALLLVRRL